MKFSFSTDGATTTNLHYKVRLLVRDKDFKEDNLVFYHLATPLDKEELTRFIASRVEPLNRMGIHIGITQVEDEDVRLINNARFIGLSGLAYILSGRGVKRETIEVKFNGKTYNVDADKYAALLESLE